MTLLSTPVLENSSSVGLKFETLSLSLYIFDFIFGFIRGWFNLNCLRLVNRSETRSKFIKRKEDVDKLLEQRDETSEWASVYEGFQHDYDE